MVVAKRESQLLPAHAWRTGLMVLLTLLVVASALAVVYAKFQSRILFVELQALSHSTAVLTASGCRVCCSQLLAASRVAPLSARSRAVCSSQISSQMLRPTRVPSISTTTGALPGSSGEHPHED